MIIFYEPILGSGPVRVVFYHCDLISITAKESPEETGVFWVKDGKLVAIEFEDVDAKNASIKLSVPETGDKFKLEIKNGLFSLESSLFGRS